MGPQLQCGLQWSRESASWRVLQPQDQRRGDIKFIKHCNTWVLDVGVVCPGTQRYVDQGSGTTPGLAAEASAAVKAKYADQDNFIPFILETGGHVNKAARDWLDALTAPEPGEQVPKTLREVSELVCLCGHIRQFPSPS